MQVDLTRAQQIHSNDPGAIKAMLDSLTEDLLADIAAPLLGAGEQMWEGLACCFPSYFARRIPRYFCS